MLIATSSRKKRIGSIDSEFYYKSGYYFYHFLPYSPTETWHIKNALIAYDWGWGLERTVSPGFFEISGSSRQFAGRKVRAARTFRANQQIEKTTSFND
jgi:hypothetical protein